MRERRKNMQKMRLTKVSLYSNIITTADRDKSPCILLPSPPFHVFSLIGERSFQGLSLGSRQVRDLSVMPITRMGKKTVIFMVGNLHISCCLRPWIYRADSVEQDQTAHTCSLILLCTLRYCVMNCYQRNPIRSDLS